MEHKIPVFISYAHKDQEALEKLVFGLNKSELIEHWYDGKIIPGERWNDKITKMLDEARIAIFLVSESFIRSEFINEVEVVRIQKKTGCSIIGVILESIPPEKYPLGDFQALPDLNKGISSYPDKKDKDNAWLTVFLGIQTVISHVLKSEHQVAKEHTDKFANLTYLIMSIMTIAVGLTGFAAVIYGMFSFRTDINAAWFYVAVGFACICLCFGGILIASKMRPNKK